jgi:hypothetical protein
LSRPDRSMSRCRWCAGVLAATLVCLPPAVSGQASEYLTLVDGYASGDLDASVTALVTWPESRVRQAATDADLGSDRAKAAVMLHTEAGFACSDQRLTSVHVDMARACLRAVPRDRRRLFAARWEGLVVSLFAGHHDFARARQEVRLALGDDANNTDVLLARGVIDEIAARSHEPNLRGEWNSDQKQRVQVAGELQTAAMGYRRALERDSALLEAHLRLGWVLFLNNSATHAREQLDEVAARASRADLQYLAHLFIGALAERDSRPEDAAREYDAAHAAAPHQSSFVARIRVAQALGRDDRAQALAAELAGVAAPDDDPWWSYNAGLTGGELVEWLRKEARTR